MRGSARGSLRRAGAVGIGAEGRATDTPQIIRCQGRLHDGRTCGRQIATLENGVVVVRDARREHVVLSTTCRHCGQRREFREGDVVCARVAA